jgi:hypothetical protein
MEKKNSNIPKLLFIVLLMTMSLPFITGFTGFPKLASLKGWVVLHEKQGFTWKSWFDGTWQEEEELYLNDHFGYRSFFVRLNNQISYSFFGKAKAAGVIIGKNNYLYEENYIKAYYGTDFVGEDSIRFRMEKLKYIQDTLAKLNKNIILIFAAGKGSFYPEYFPEEYKTEKGITNYQTYLKYANLFNINYIDFNKYFVDNKYKSTYPLYPQYGIHWSEYGALLAADSILRYIEKLCQIDLPNLYWDQVALQQPQKTDYDIAEGLNLMFHLRSFEMAYPKMAFESDTGKIKPSVIAVADSYYWQMFNFGISSAFNLSHFWFYNKQIYPDSHQSSLETSQINMGDEIAKHDVIIIMATEATLPSLGWGFIENAYDFFHTHSPSEPRR